jgi:hypothetical protein
VPRERIRRAALVAEMAGQTEAARIGRFYLNAAHRMKDAYRERGMTPLAPMIVLAGLEGLGSLAAQVIVREKGLPAAESNAVAGYVMAGLYDVWTGVVQTFDQEDYAAWRAAGKRGPDDGDRGDGAAAHDGASERQQAEG